MPLPDKVNTLPDWSMSATNRWADYIEILCLKNVDHMISVDDLLDLYSDERTEELVRGASEHSAKIDQIVMEMGNFFKLIRYRADTLEDYYPFHLDERDCIILKSDISEYHLFYIFLLLASNLSFFDRSVKAEFKLTH